MRDLLWLIPVLPFAAALANGVLLHGRIGKRAVAWIACGSVALSALLGLAIIADHFLGPEGSAPFQQDLYLWVPGGPLETTTGGWRDVEISMGFLLDPLSAVMLFVVTFVGFWIHLYSVGYMAHEEGFQRYFTYLNLFMGAMLLLVLGNNYLVTFVGWEGVGLCSYLLIGFYYKEDFPPYAGRKAFIVNRVGDFGFLLGLFALVSTFGTLRYTDVFATIAANPGIATAPFVGGVTLAAFVAFCLFVGAMGKSAQIPLYVWLPDAMAGPTPVSALIHAATMVTAGVYMVARSNVLYQLAGGVSLFVAVIGAATALFAATIGLAQTDIKKVLAYSTVSQLGYMFLAAGVGAYTAAIFHLMTHAFFKGLLFLGSGSVIHAMGGEQDMRKMGGLKRHLPATSRTFFIGCLAISGIPPLAGFFSKDEILHGVAGAHRWALFAVGLLTAGLTAFYMFRAYYMTFHGEFRGTHEQEHHLHESPRIMTLPLWVLAVGAVVAGWVGLPRGVTEAIAGRDLNVFHHFLEPVVYTITGAAPREHHMALWVELSLIVVSVGMGVLGWMMSRSFYRAGLERGAAWAARFPAAHRVLVNKYYVDELYDATVVRGTWGAAGGLYRFDAGVIDGVGVHGARNATVTGSQLSGFFDKYVVDGLVNLVGIVLSLFSRGFRRVQTGYVGNYALVLATGLLVLVCAYALLRW